jgi:cytochrome c553
MKQSLTVVAVLALAPAALGADIEAGKSKAQAVCAACHGATGISVSDTIPHLAGQRVAYLEGQLKGVLPAIVLDWYGRPLDLT